MDKYTSSKYAGGSSNSKYAQSAIAAAQSKQNQRCHKEPGIWRPTPETLAGIPSKPGLVTAVYRSPRHKPGASTSTEEAMSKPAPFGIKRVINVNSAMQLQNRERGPNDRRSMSPPEDLNHPFYMRPSHNYSPISIPASESQHARLDREGRVYYPPGSGYRCLEALKKNNDDMYRRNKERTMNNHDFGYCSGSGA